MTDPALPGPLSAEVKQGSSPYWLALLTGNTGNPLASVQVQTSSGWLSLARASYNYWIAAVGGRAGAVHRAAHRHPGPPGHRGGRHAEPRHGAVDRNLDVRRGQRHGTVGGGHVRGRHPRGAVLRRVSLRPPAARAAQSLRGPVAGAAAPGTAPVSGVAAGQPARRLRIRRPFPPLQRLKDEQRRSWCSGCARIDQLQLAVCPAGDEHAAGGIVDGHAVGLPDGWPCLVRDQAGARIRNDSSRLVAVSVT